MPEEIVCGVALPSRQRQPEHDDGGEVRDNDGDIERTHG